MKSLRIAIALSGFLLCCTGLLCLTSAAEASEQQVQYFPQFADGGGYTTTWYFTGYGTGLTSVDIQIFDKNGYRQSLATDQGTSNLFHLSLNGYGSTSLRTLGGDSSVKSGWVLITSNQPLGATKLIDMLGTAGL